MKDWRDQLLELLLTYPWGHAQCLKAPQGVSHPIDVLRVWLRHCASLLQIS
jgi:hypothetical protein